MGQPAESRATAEFRSFWEFYRRYTKTAVHAASAAGLAIFGILVFLDPWFAALAIASYTVPPVVLYLVTEDPLREATSAGMSGDDGSERSGGATTRRGSGTDTDIDTGADPVEPETALIRPASGSGDGDTDSDSDIDDGDTDSDSDDGDTDSDSDTDDGDSDSDGDDGDTDSDTDG